VPGGKDGTRGG